MIKFSDGIEFETNGKYRIECRHDGYYVVGEGILCGVDNLKEGYDLIDGFQKKKEE